MKYTFDIVGVSPILHFFTHQQHQENSHSQGVEYLVSHKCTLDAFLETVEPVPSKWGWNMDEVVDTVIKFWMNNSDSISYWKSRLTDAGNDNILVARVADMKALKSEFNSLLGEA
ncbi:MAG: hypothetical protein WBA41_14645 [Rivularia sp. (in: cyanobacteria)]